MTCMIRLNHVMYHAVMYARKKKKKRKESDCSLLYHQRNCSHLSAGNWKESWWVHFNLFCHCEFGIQLVWCAFSCHVFLTDLAVYKASYVSVAFVSQTCYLICYVLEAMWGPPLNGPGAKSCLPSPSHVHCHVCRAQFDTQSDCLVRVSFRVYLFS